MFEPLGTPRKLPFPLYNQETNGNTTSDLGLPVNEFVWPEDPEERVVVPFLFSQREFTAVLSALDVGADIAYPEQYIEVYWLLVRSLKYSVPICEQIIECIENTPEVIESIISALETSDRFNDYISERVRGLTTGQIVGKIIPGDCDNSTLAGRVVAIVERMNTYNVDALEIIEVGTNDEEKIAAVLEGIPVMGELPVGDIIDFAQDFLEDFFENYSAAVTEEWKDSVEEDLYCLARESVDCSLTFEQLFNYFQQRASSGLTIASVLQDVIGFAISGDFIGDEAIASGMYALQIAFMRVGQEYFGLNLPKMGGLIRDAVPSTKWEDWDDCVDECEYPKPPSVTWLYGNVLNVVDDVYEVQAQFDGANYVVTWPDQPYSDPREYQLEFFSLEYTSGESDVYRVYGEATTVGSASINTETDPGPLNFPYCLSLLQIASHTTAFVARIGLR